MEPKSKSRKRKDLSKVATPTRSSRMRLNGKGDGSDRSAVVEGNRDNEGPFVESPVMPVNDLRVHRIFSPVSVGGSNEIDDCGSKEKAIGSEIGFENTVGSLGRNGDSEGIEVIRDRVQATPPDEVIGEAKIVDASEKTNVGSHKHHAGRRSPGSRVLKPCTRTKLFVNPSSFSYRRLLPYLMDITKGAFKSLDMKPQLPEISGNSEVESSISTLEPKFCCETGSSSLRHVPSPSKISGLSICTESIADTKVPLNYSLRDQEVLDSASTCNLSYGQTKVSVEKNDKLSQSDGGKVMAVLGGMAACGNGEAMKDSNCVDSAIQQSPDENRSDLMDVLEDTFLCKGLDSDDVHVAKKNDVKFDEPLPNIHCNNSTEVAQETPLDNEVSTSKDILGIAKCVMKPNGIISNTRNSDHEQLAVREANSTFSSEAMCGSSSVHSVTQCTSGENTCEQTNVLGNGLSCKHLDLSDAHEAKENVVYYDKPQSAICSQDNSEFVQRTPVSSENVGRIDLIEKVRSISKLESQLDDSAITNAENSVCEELNGSADSKQSPSSERKLYLKPRRLKRFKNYNSVSYRKLLPYLTEIYKDSAGSSNKGQVQIDWAPAFVGDAIEKGNSTSVSSTAFPDDSNPISGTSCDVEPEMTTFERFPAINAVANSPTESDLENGLKSPIDQQLLSDIRGQPILSPPSSCSPNDMHIGECIEKSQCTASNFKEEDMERNKQYSDDPHLSDIVSVYPGPISPHRRPFVSPTRGILKNNPRGCRGLCTCLKCASFRLHAENAFEFSRSQLLDSEEIALELINELSLLRNLLKKSTDADSGEKSQVQEACDKAYSIEQHAKARFEQMNHDLRIHCQIPILQRPTVSFARYFEEKIFQTADWPRKNTALDGRRG